MLKSQRRAGDLLCCIATIAWFLLYEVMVIKMYQICLQNIPTADLCHDFIRNKYKSSVFRCSVE